MKRAILFILGVVTLLAMTSCAGGASGGNGAETSNLRLSIGAGDGGRSANGRLSLFTNGSLSVDIKDSSGNLITSGSTNIVNGSGTVIIGGVTVGSEIIAEATVMTDGNTFVGTSSPTEVQEGTTNISITVMASGTSLTIPNNPDSEYISKFFEKLTDGQTYTLTVGSISSNDINSLFSSIKSKSSCSFYIVLSSDYNSTLFTTGGVTNCTNVISIDMSESTTIQDINSYAFSGWTGLTTVKLSQRTDNILAYAFSNCTSLSSLDMKNVSDVSNYAFNGVSTSLNIRSDKSNISVINWDRPIFGNLNQLIFFNNSLYTYNKDTGVFTQYY